MGNYLQFEGNLSYLTSFLFGRGLYLAPNMAQENPLRPTLEIFLFPLPDPVLLVCVSRSENYFF